MARRCSTPRIGVDARKPRSTTQFDVAARESGSFIDPAPGAVVVNPDPAATPTDLTDGPRKGRAAQAGRVRVPRHRRPRAAVPARPALARRVVHDAARRRGDPPAARGRRGADWYDRRPFRLRIEDGVGCAGLYNAAQRLLTVLLPQAEMVTVRLSSFVDSADLEPAWRVWMLERRGGVRAAQQADAEPAGTGCSRRRSR